jgi:hypothetical protein
MVAKPGNQDALKLSYRGNHTFESKKDGLKLVFVPKEKKLFVEEGNQRYEFTRR